MLHLRRQIQEHATTLCLGEQVDNREDVLRVSDEIVRPPRRGGMIVVCGAKNELAREE